MEEASEINYEGLLELAVDFAYELQSCGAETYRVEETILRLMDAYGVQGAAFVIPNCIIASLETQSGKHLTRMRRNAVGSTDLDSIERYNGLCRQICRDKPPLDEADALFRAETKRARSYSLPIQLLAYFLAGGGFAMFFQGTLLDGLCGGICGIATGLCLLFMTSLRANPFFKTVSSGFVLAFLAQVLALLGFAHNVDAVIIGALMLLVPGLLFTNSVRDVIYGDTMSGVNRLVQVLIIAIALAVGSGAAVALTRQLWGEVDGASSLMNYSLAIQCLICSVGSLGFSLLFNLRGPGITLCILGGCFSWIIYRVCGVFGLSDVVAFLIAAAAVSAYSEIMARIRKCPATGYLLVSLFPLIPGANIYYTMDYALRGNIDQFLRTGLHTGALAGALAVGVLLVSTGFRMWGVWKYKFRKRSLRKGA